MHAHGVVENRNRTSTGLYVNNRRDTIQLLLGSCKIPGPLRYLEYRFGMYVMSCYVR